MDKTEKVFIEVTYPDGTIARWAIDETNVIIDMLEKLLGQPDTLKP